MLRQIKLRNFKCFDAQELTCAPLTLLCGLNGMGKSSIIQALLVLRQSFEREELRRDRLVVSGELADLGTGRDILCADADTDTIGFELQASDTSEPCSLAFDYSRDSDRLKARENPFSATANGEIRDAWGKLPPFGGNLVYLNAERLGPRKAYNFSETRAELGSLGTRGEYAWNYLSTHQGDRWDNEDQRTHPQHSGLHLLDAVSCWLREISPGVHLEFETIMRADAVIAGFSFDRAGDIKTDAYRATNVGFGLSYVLPVLTGLLATPPGSLCLIENPEAHVHPRGQTRLAELAVRASLAGIQVIAETHSDHFLDGVRIAVREGQASPENIAIHYFDRVNGNAATTSPKLNADGRIDSWPAGFFDQHEENLARLLAPKP